MKRTLLPFLAAASLLVAQALLPALLHVSTARASTRPHYGGTLRVKLSARVASLDPAEKPAEWAEATAKMRLLRLVFDPLVRLDENGQPIPALALSWKSDAAAKRWEFHLRPGVKFHDGTVLAPSDVVAALAKQNEGWRVSAAGDSVVVQDTEEQPNLPFVLSIAFISRNTADGAVVGTGPFRVANWQPSARAVFSASEDYWEGRPFVDSIEMEMGRALRDQLLDFELGKADLVELAPDQIRGVTQSGKKTWASVPVEFYVLSNAGAPSSAFSLELRDALVLAIDRAAIHNVLLQKQGEIAGGCLPQWLSGYSFLFSTERNLGEARKARARIPGNLAPLVLGYDPADSLSRLIADRVALNAREIGVTLQVKPQNALGKDAHPDVELLRMNVGVPNAGLAMDYVCPSTHWGYSMLKPEDFEQMYKLELESLERKAPHRIPLFYLPESFAISARVKNWKPYRWGEWRLADVWLAPDESAAPAAKVPVKP